MRTADVRTGNDIDRWQEGGADWWAESNVLGVTGRSIEQTCDCVGALLQFTDLRRIVRFFSSRLRRQSVMPSCMDFSIPLRA